MNRRNLLQMASRLGVRTTVYLQGKTVSKSNDRIRVDLLERCYGPNLGVAGAGNKPELDKAIGRAVACAVGDLGYLPRVAQRALRRGSEDRVEAVRLSGLQSKPWHRVEAAHKSARQWFEIARIAQELHAVESGINHRGEV